MAKFSGALRNDGTKYSDPCVQLRTLQEAKSVVRRLAHDPSFSYLFTVWDPDFGEPTS